MRTCTVAVTFPAAGGGPLLEGVLHLPEGSGPFDYALGLRGLGPKAQDKPFPAAIVCHPHPLMGGTMGNAIVAAVLRVYCIMRRTRKGGRDGHR